MTYTTELLSYVLLLFVVFIYLPYTFFTMMAECSVDLGRRRDATQLEQIVSAFLPSLVLHIPAFLLSAAVVSFWGQDWQFDYTIFGTIFARDRGTISDYLYAGNWKAGFSTYVFFLWLSALLIGLMFGRAAKWVCSKQVALDGVEQITFKEIKKDGTKIPLWVRCSWGVWRYFFHESFVPLYTWKETKPFVRVETTDHRLYYGTFIGYEKTTDGCFDAIRLRSARCLLYEKAESYCLRGKSPLSQLVSHLYLRWSHVADLRVISQAEYDSLESEVGRECEKMLLARSTRPRRPEAHA